MQTPHVLCLGPWVLTFSLSFSVGRGNGALEGTAFWLAVTAAPTSEALRSADAACSCSFMPSCTSHCLAYPMHQSGASSTLFFASFMAAGHLRISAYTPLRFEYRCARMGGGQEQEAAAAAACLSLVVDALIPSVKYWMASQVATIPKQQTASREQNRLSTCA